MSVLRERQFLRRLLVGLALALFFTWLALRPQPAQDAADGIARREIFALGTLVEITLWLGEERSREAAEAALAQAEQLLRQRERQWSAWGDGELGDFNRRLAAGQAAPVPPPLRPLFARAWSLRERSGGAFDPRVGRLVQLWGFDDEAHYRTEPPPAADIDAARRALAAAPAYRAGAPFGPAPGVTWDFGAIAKGAIIDEIGARLVAAGFDDHLVNAGGNLKASGRHGERPWRIGIRAPRGGPAELLASLQTEAAEGIVTSGDYERFFEHGGRRYHHILDPQSGAPARGLQAVTVVAPEALLADAASTALFVAGPDRWPSMAEALGVQQVLVVDDEGRAAATPALAARLRGLEDLQIVPLQIVPPS